MLVLVPSLSTCSSISSHLHYIHSTFVSRTSIHHHRHWQGRFERIVSKTSLSQTAKMAAAASSNPITSAVPSSKPISSVSQSYAPAPIYNNPPLLSRLNLDLRGRVFPVDRETLMLLPESVLLGLFPQGLVLSKPASWEGADDGVFTVDVSRVSSSPNPWNTVCYLAEDDPYGALRNLRLTLDPV